MNWLRWNIAVLAIVVGVAAATAAVNYHINFYGLFGDVTGKKYSVYDNERTTKYLFSYNYIPSNFDGLLVGSSSTANWNTGELTGIRVYNASVNGGNVTEEAIIVDQVLRQVHPKLVLFLIHPYLTETYGRKSGFMNRQEYWGALGSIQLFRGYWNRWLIERGFEKQEFNEFGSDDFVVPQLQGGAKAQRSVSMNLFIDPRALQEYRDLTERVRSTGARIAAVIPPVRMEAWNAVRGQFYDYCQKIRPLFRANEPIIDLNNPEMDEFRKNPENYQDEIHLSRLGASRVVQIIGQRLKQMGLLAAPVGTESVNVLPLLHSSKDR